MDGVHFGEKMVPVKQEQICVAVVSALEDSSDLLKLFRGDEGGDLGEIGHFWFIIFLLESVPFVEVHSLSQLQLW